MSPLIAEPSRSLKTDADRRTLRAAADVMVPAQGRMPAASAVGAHRYIERIARADPSVELLLVEGIRAIAARAEATAHAHFDVLPIDRQAVVLVHHPQPVELLRAAAGSRVRGVLHAAPRADVDRLHVPFGAQSHRGPSAVRPAARGTGSPAGAVPSAGALMPLERADVVVIGSGAAGAAVTWRLAMHGASVVCLEQGDWLRPDGAASARHMLEAAGAARILDSGRVMNFAHYMGTARMGHDPARSVVNARHQAHDVPNLFVVDGSSFTTSGGVNPTSTIGALALRAAVGIWSRRKERP
jgi:hypothetical protein